MVGAGVSAGDPVPHGAFLQPVRRGAEGAFRSGAAMNACLEISGLSATLANGTRVLRSVSLSVEPGEVRALVGESGAGKSMIGKAVLGVLPSSVRIVEGSIRLEGSDLGALSARERRRVIGAKTALIPQDPLTALN